jgi:hypothetical protein
MIMGVYLLGWLGTELTPAGRSDCRRQQPVAGAAAFRRQFRVRLGAAIVILTLAGRELGILELLPEGEREIDDRDTSLTRLLVITLLPFLCM